LSLPTSTDLRVLLAYTQAKQQDIAKAVGLSVPHFSYIVNGKRPAPPETLRAIERAILEHYVTQGRLAQGLPARVEDPAALRQVAGMVKTRPAK
jgi:DNA-binding transcriptional regulator YdaS (Cro superfamily)